MTENYRPPFEITKTILMRVSQISEVIGHINASNIGFSSPILRKENRIKTITGTLAIEGNTLNLDQVSDIIDGKKVLGSIREITEVHGTIKAYERLNSFNMPHEDDLLKAHSLLMGGVLKETGVYRKGNVGVHKNGGVVHVAPQVRMVSKLMNDLLSWLHSSDDHPLIQSCVFHYEFEFIHPFSDGNGRMGRLWQTLILSKWKSIFEFLPIESVIKENQEGYYQALGKADDDSNSTIFIEFMLDVILQTCKDALETSQYVPLNVPRNVPLKRLEQIVALISENREITIEQMAELCGVSTKTIKRDLAKLKNENRIERVGSLKSGYWKVKA